MKNNEGDVVRFHLIRIIPDFARYEPRNIGIVTWNVTNFKPRARVDTEVFHRVAEETGFLHRETIGYVAEIARGFERSILRQLDECADSDAADALIAKEGLRASAYTAYIVERPGAILLSESAFKLDERLATLEGCIDHLMERLVLPR
ncbi:MAG: hypothetical protein ACXWQ5_00550 [Ktedonobacterales bacterium]